MNIKKMSVLAVVASISMLMTACASPPQPTWKKKVLQMTIPSLHYLNADMRYVLTIFLPKKKTK